MTPPRRSEPTTATPADPAAFASPACGGEGPGACPDCVHDLPLIIRFFIIHNTTMRIADRLTAPLGMTSSRWLMLCAINRREEDEGGPPRISDLSADAMLSAQNVSRMVAAMEDEGLVERFSVPGGGRATYVRLTARGKDVIAQCDRLGERFDERFLARLSAGDVELLKNKLDLLIENLAGYEQDLARQKESQE
jgi:DNA-binding MarR family transcriptional regulator